MWHVAHEPHKTCRLHFVCAVFAERGKTGDDDTDSEFVDTEVKSGCCVRQRGDADEAITGPPSVVCEFARAMFHDGENTENADLDSSESGSSCLVASAAKPRNVLTDVVMRLTFDNTAYVEEVCDGVEALGLLPDRPPRNSPSIFLHTLLWRNYINFSENCIL